MLPVWVPEITFGNAICITLIVFVYLDLRARVRSNLVGIRESNNNAILAATHSKLTFDNTTAAAVNLRSAVASTKADIADAVASITSAAAAEHTPTATVLPTEFRVTIAKETDAPAAAAGK